MLNRDYIEEEEEEEEEEDLFVFNDHIDGPRRLLKVFFFFEFVSDAQQQPLLCSKHRKYCCVVNIVSTDAQQQPQRIPVGGETKEQFGEFEGCSVVW